MKVAEIKSELDNLGMTYNSGLRKAELLALLQTVTKDTEIQDDYSPPYTRRKTMATEELGKVSANLFKMESSPINHASAVIEELQDSSSEFEQESVDVKITKESPDEHVVVNESNTLAEELLSDNQASVEEYSSEVTDSDDSSESNKIDVTQQVTRRRSERLRGKGAHVACTAGEALFSDDETPSLELSETADVTIPRDPTEVENKTKATLSDARMKLVRYFFLAILCLVIANVLAFHPCCFGDVHLKVTSLLEHLYPRNASTSTN